MAQRHAVEERMGQQADQRPNPDAGRDHRFGMGFVTVMEVGRQHVLCEVDEQVADDGVVERERDEVQPEYAGAGGVRAPLRLLPRDARGAFEAVEDDQAEERDQVYVVLQRGQPAGALLARERLLSFAQLGQYVDEDVRHRHAARDGEPDAAREAFEEAELAGEDVDGAQRQGEDERSGGFHARLGSG